MDNSSRGRPFAPPKPPPKPTNPDCERLRYINGYADCFSVFTCCDCGGKDCGCRYCWSCRACDSCLQHE